MFRKVLLGVGIFLAISVGIGLAGSDETPDTTTTTVEATTTTVAPTTTTLAPTTTTVAPTTTTTAIELSGEIGFFVFMGYMEDSTEVPNVLGLMTNDDKLDVGNDFCEKARSGLSMEGVMLKQIDELGSSGNDKEIVATVAIINVGASTYLCPEFQEAYSAAVGN